MSQNTWAPLWGQVVESTLWEESLEVRVLFLTMLALKDYHDHVVRMPFRRLCKKANMDPDKVQWALDILMNPDKKSVDEQPEEGRRIKLVEDGWLVINGEYYKKEMDRLTRRLKKAKWQRDYRHRIKENGIASGETAADRLQQKAESEGDINTAKRIEELRDEVKPGTYSKPEKDDETPF